LCSSWAYDAARELQGVVVGELLAVLGVDSECEEDEESEEHRWLLLLASRSSISGGWGGWGGSALEPTLICCSIFWRLVCGCSFDAEVVEVATVEHGHTSPVPAPDPAADEVSILRADVPDVLQMVCKRNAR